MSITLCSLFILEHIELSYEGREGHIRAIEKQKVLREDN